MKRVLFLCIQNSARSQMAEALLRHLAAQRFQVCSAGVSPGVLHPLAIAVMGEVGIDITGQRPKNLDQYAGDSFDYAISVCDEAREGCPIFPRASRQLHWSLPDPSAARGDEAARLGAFRRARDDLAARIRQFISEAEP